MKSEKPPPPSKPTPDRNNLLEEIKKFKDVKNLRKVDSTDIKERPSSVKSLDGGGGSIIDLITRRIDILRKDIETSDEDDEDDEDDDEWDA